MEYINVVNGVLFCERYVINMSKHIEPTHVVHVHRRSLEHTILEQNPAKELRVITMGTGIPYVSKILGGSELRVVSSIAEAIALARLMNQDIRELPQVF